MKQARLSFFWLVLAVSLLLVGGCASMNSSTDPGTPGGTVKLRGVYTTLAVPGHALDLPGSQYASVKSFGPGENPAAVVVGYGFPNGDRLSEIPESYTLQLSEVASGTVLFSREGAESYGQASVLPLPIRKSGAYRLKLFVNQAEVDAWDFAVQRDPAAGGTDASAPARAYAQGNFSAGLEPDTFLDELRAYDDAFLYTLVNAARKEMDQADQQAFAQVYPGRVVIQFTEHENGQIDAPQIMENTLNETFGKVFLQALTSLNPAKPWPAGARPALGRDTLVIKATFYFE